jgi:hypothetical protein
MPPGGGVREHPIPGALATQSAYVNNYIIPQTHNFAMSLSKLKATEASLEYR